MRVGDELLVFFVSLLFDEHQDRFEIELSAPEFVTVEEYALAFKPLNDSDTGVHEIFAEIRADQGLDLSD